MRILSVYSEVSGSTIPLDARYSILQGMHLARCFIHPPSVLFTPGFLHFNCLFCCSGAKDLSAMELERNGLGFPIAYSQKDLDRFFAAFSF